MKKLNYISQNILKGFNKMIDKNKLIGVKNNLQVVGKSCAYIWLTQDIYQTVKSGNLSMSSAWSGTLKKSTEAKEKKNVNDISLIIMSNWRTKNILQNFTYKALYMRIWKWYDMDLQLREKERGSDAHK